MWCSWCVSLCCFQALGGETADSAAPGSIKPAYLKSDSLSHRSSTSSRAKVFPPSPSASHGLSHSLRGTDPASGICVIRAIRKRDPQARCAVLLSVWPFQKPRARCINAFCGCCGGMAAGCIGCAGIGVACIGMPMRKFWGCIAVPCGWPGIAWPGMGAPGWPGMAWPGMGAGIGCGCAPGMPARWASTFCMGWAWGCNRGSIMGASIPRGKFFLRAGRLRGRSLDDGHRERERQGVGIVGGGRVNAHSREPLFHHLFTLELHPLAIADE